MSNSERRLHARVLALAATALDFGLAAPETAELEGHLAGCPACARTAAGLRVDAAALRRPAELVPSYRVDAAVAAAIAGHPARRPAASRTLVLVAATALLLVALLGLAAVRRFPAPRPAANRRRPDALGTGGRRGAEPLGLTGAERRVVAVAGHHGQDVCRRGRRGIPGGPRRSTTVHAHDDLRAARDVPHQLVHGVRRSR